MEKRLTAKISTKHPRKAIAKSHLQSILLNYTIVHAIPGRLRLRPRPEFRPFNQETAIRKQIEAAFPGATFTISPKTKSILVLAPLDSDAGTKVEKYTPKLHKVRTKQQDVPAVRNPIPNKVRSFFYPRFFVFVQAVFHAVPYIFKGLKMLFTGRLTLDVLDGAALLVCLLQRDFRSLSSITFFFALGEYLAEWTKKKSRACLAESLALNIEQVWIRADGAEILIPFSNLAVGHEVIVRAGSAMPVDGTVIAGEGMINQASLTGEPLAVPKEEGASVYAGTILEEGEIIVRATQVGSGTRINAILKTIEESENAKAAVQSKYEHIADAIVPYNFLLSAAVYATTQSPMRAGSVLLVDYSCAIRLAAPLCVFTAMQEAATRGILIKGGKFLEAIAEADVLVFDKTGTLTNARPELVGVIPFGGRKRTSVLRLAACLEEHFAHPVGQAVVRASDAEGLKHREEHTKVEFIVAHGIASSWHGQRVLIGSAHFVLGDESIPISPEQTTIADEESKKGRSVLYLAVGGKLAGLLLIEDLIRDDAADVIRRLKEDGVKRVIMLTGDSKMTAESIATQAGIDEFQAQMLPEDKAAFVTRLRNEGCKIAMIGDGINDSPALSAAQVGIAMAEGADMTKEVADIVLMSGRLDSLLTARAISRTALKRIHSNFHASLLWNSAFLMGGLLGALTPGLSAFLHNATTAAIAVSSIRPLLPLDMALPEASSIPTQRNRYIKGKYMISSFYEGRVRLRHQALKNPELLSSLQLMISTQDGIVEMQANPKTGSLLVFYDPEVISHEQLLFAVEALETQFPKQEKETKAKIGGSCGLGRMRLSRRNETVLLCTAYGLTAVGGFINTRLHIVSGALFTLLAAKHLYNRRRSI